jgi:ABC-type sugar transport system ATPase subunit
VEVALPAVGGAVMRCDGIDGLKLAVGQKVAVSARPEAVEVDAGGDGAAPNRLDCTVEAMLYLGDRSECEVRAGTETFSVLVDGERIMRPGEKLCLRFPPERLTVWPL